jgi:exonuclease III
MNLISWNCRGLGNPQTVRELHQMVKLKHPHFLFLIETKVKSSWLQWLRNTLGFAGLLTVDPVGRSGGLALFWKDMHYVELLSYSQQHINVKVQAFRSGAPWVLSGFYSHPKPAHREEVWKLLSYLRSIQSLPCLCLGNFNEVVDNSEKVGGNSKTEQHMRGFIAMIQDCNFWDLGYKGLKFTWSNKQSMGAFVKERLDRGLAILDWCALFPNAGIEVEPSYCSDHYPLWLRLDRDFWFKSRIFRYEASWSISKE